MSLEQPPEVHGLHPRGGRFRWLEMMVSVSALAVSAVSIFIALQHGNAMEKLVAANSIPYVEIMSGNAIRGADGEFRQGILIELRNVGVGPANVRSVRVSTEGRSIANTREWIAMCCEGDEAVARETLDAMDFVLNQSSTHFVPAGENAMLIYAPRTEANAEAFTRVDAVRMRTRFEICYCSVFDECWRTSSVDDEPVPVASCPEPNDRFIP
jgi:hypothetical protein